MGGFFFVFGLTLSDTKGIAGGGDMGGNEYTGNIDFSRHLPEFPFCRQCLLYPEKSILAMTQMKLTCRTFRRSGGSYSHDYQ